jgi:hypothetical protein
MDQMNYYLFFFMYNKIVMSLFSPANKCGLYSYIEIHFQYNPHNLTGTN